MEILFRRHAKYIIYSRSQRIARLTFFQLSYGTDNDPGTIISKVKQMFVSPNVRQVMLQLSFVAILQTSEACQE